MHLPRVSGKTNPEEVCRFINAEFTVRMNPFSHGRGLDPSWENYAPYKAQRS